MAFDMLHLCECCTPVCLLALPHLKYAAAAWLRLVALHLVLPHDLQGLLEVFAQQQAQLGQGLNRDCEQREAANQCLPLQSALQHALLSDNGSK
jgi:hypothetical protein